MAAAQTLRYYASIGIQVEVTRIVPRLVAAGDLMCRLTKFSPATVVDDVTYIFGKGHDTAASVIFIDNKYMPYRFEFGDGDGTVPEYALPIICLAANLV